MVCKKICFMLCLVGALSLLSGCSVVESDDTETVVSSENNGKFITDIVSSKQDENDALQETIVSEEEILDEAILLIGEKKYPQAIGLLTEIKDNAYAKELLSQLRYLISGDYIENLYTGVAAINSNGEVVICFNREESYDYYSLAEEWTDIRRLSYAFEGIDAVDSEGNFFTTVDEEWMKERTDKLTSLSNLELLSTGSSDYAALDKNGKLYAYSKNCAYLESMQVQEELESWGNIVDVETGEQTVVVLHEDGTVSFVYSNKQVPLYYNASANVYDNMESWTDIVDIAYYGMDSVIGLKSDGTVVVSDSVEGAYGDYFAVEKWTDIIAISKSYFNVLGLKSDGTVVAVGSGSEQQSYVSDWTDIVAVSAGDYFHFGLKSDGTLVVAPAGKECEDLVLPDVSGISDLYVPSVNLQ